MSDAGAVLLRVVAGGAVAAIIAFAARRVHSLSLSGAIAATIVGTICAAAGWSWAALLIAFFLSSTALSRLRAAEKARRIYGIVSKGGERDAWQVLANGGVFTGAAVGWMVMPSPLLLAIAAGSLAAATADTWGTELGTLARGAPRLITTWREAPAGTSGAVTALGSLSVLLGALAFGFATAVAGWGRPVAIAACIGGIAGALADTLLGAVLQSRRWCATCESATEQRVHRCGSHTVARGGVAWLDNDAVNFLCGVVGAAVALWVIAWTP
ncbi:MAG: DUF92 domain-containing protein [Gemmatimonadota bacterium]|nr:DUF92 domain-containing protein [Gemmatimonadota bacterium]